jgi:DnaJ-class molecular chaperone
VLGIDRHAGKDEIRSAYRRKSMELHQAGASETAQVDLNIARDRGLEQA